MPRARRRPRILHGRRHSNMALLRLDAVPAPLRAVDGRVQLVHGGPSWRVREGYVGEETMAEQLNDLALLQDPVAQELLASRQSACLAYTWMDGTPRVVPLWFHWDGHVVTFGTPLRAPKLRALANNSHVAATIEDATAWPYKALLMRGEASVEILDHVSPEYEASARRYLGDAEGEAWVSGLRSVPMARITIEPLAVHLLDFVTRFPSALSA